MTTRSTLKILAALLWVSGGVVLSIKSVSLLSEANMLQPQGAWGLLAIILGVLIGLLKTKFIFRNACRKNLRRIDQLIQPKWWQFYRVQFFLFLSLMILLGTTLSRAAQGDYPLLIGMAIVDISLATALLTSSATFFREWVVQ